MGKTLYGKYLDACVKIGVNLPSFVVRKIWVSIRYPFQPILFVTFHVEVKLKLRIIEKDS